MPINLNKNFQDFIKYLKNPPKKRDDSQLNFIVNYFDEKNILQILKKCKINKLDPKAILYCFAKNMKTQKLAKDEKLFDFGDFADKFYLIIKGKVSVLAPMKKMVLLSQREYYEYLDNLLNDDEIPLLDLILNNNLETNSFESLDDFLKYKFIISKINFKNDLLIEDCGNEFSNNFINLETRNKIEINKNQEAPDYENLGVRFNSNLKSGKGNSEKEKLNLDNKQINENDGESNLSNIIDGDNMISSRKNKSFKLLVERKISHNINLKNKLCEKPKANSPIKEKKSLITLHTKNNLNDNSFIQQIQEKLLKNQKNLKVNDTEWKLDLQDAYNNGYSLMEILNLKDQNEDISIKAEKNSEDNFLDRKTDKNFKKIYNHNSINNLTKINKKFNEENNLLKKYIEKEKINNNVDDKHVSKEQILNENKKKEENNSSILEKSKNQSCLIESSDSMFSESSTIVSENDQKLKIRNLYIMKIKALNNNRGLIKESDCIYQQLIDCLVITKEEENFLKKYENISDDKEKIEFILYELQIAKDLTQGYYFGDFKLNSKIKKRKTTVRMEEETILGYIDKLNYIENVQIENEIILDKEINVLNNMVFFKSLKTPYFKKYFFPSFNKREILKEEIIQEQGEEVKHFHYIKNGKLEILFTGSLFDLNNLFKELLEQMFEKGLIEQNEIQQLIAEYIETEKIKMFLNNKEFENLVNLRKTFSLFSLNFKEIAAIEAVCLRMNSFFKIKVQVENTCIYSFPVDKLHDLCFYNSESRKNLKQFSCVKLKVMLKRLADIQDVILKSLTEYKRKIRNLILMRKPSPVYPTKFRTYYVIETKTDFKNSCENLTSSFSTKKLESEIIRENTVFENTKESIKIKKQKTAKIPLKKSKTIIVNNEKLRKTDMTKKQNDSSFNNIYEDNEYYDESEYSSSSDKFKKKEECNEIIKKQTPQKVVINKSSCINSLEFNVSNIKSNSHIENERFLKSSAYFTNGEYSENKTFKRNLSLVSNLEDNKDIDEFRISFSTQIERNYNNIDNKQTLQDKISNVKVALNSNINNNPNLYVNIKGLVKTEEKSNYYQKPFLETKRYENILNRHSKGIIDETMCKIPMLNNQKTKFPIEDQIKIENTKEKFYQQQTNEMEVRQESVSKYQTNTLREWINETLERSIQRDSSAKNILENSYSNDLSFIKNSIPFFPPINSTSKENLKQYAGQVEKTSTMNFGIKNNNFYANKQMQILKNKNILKMRNSEYLEKANYRLLNSSSKKVLKINDNEINEKDYFMRNTIILKKTNINKSPVLNSYNITNGKLLLPKADENNQIKKIILQTNVKISNKNSLMTTNNRDLNNISNLDVFENTSKEKSIYENNFKSIRVDLQKKFGREKIQNFNKPGFKYLSNESNRCFEKIISSEKNKKNLKEESIYKSYKEICENIDVNTNNFLIDCEVDDLNFNSLPGKKIIKSIQNLRSRVKENIAKRFSNINSKI